MPRSRSSAVPKFRPAQIIQLAVGQWSTRDGKLNSCLYGLMSDGRVLQYVPSATPEDAGWKRLNMRPAAPPTFHGRDEWETEL